MNKEIENKLSEIFYVIFDLDSNTDLLKISQETLEKWDSLSHVTLITAIESEFDIYMNIEDSQSMSSFTSAVTLINKLRNA